MAFKLKSKGEIFGINEELSTYDTPVFEKKLDKGILAEANRDGSTFVDKDASMQKKKEAIKHEDVHHDQMSQGRLDYTNEIVTWKKDTKSPSRVYKRMGGSLVNMKTGESDQEGGNFEWEAEAYEKT